MTENYTLWFAQELKKLIDLLAEGKGIEHIETQLSEINRGIEYGTTVSGSIETLLLKMGQNIADSMRIHLRQQRRPGESRFPGGIPPGGTPTILTGGGGRTDTTPPPGFPGAAPSGTNHEEPLTYSVDELKSALESRKKKSVESKMKGSLDLLKDYDET